MFKNSKISVSLLAAILLAGVFFYGAFTYLSEARSTIYLFRDNYTAGTQIEESMLAATEVDTRMIQGAFAIIQDGNARFITKGNKDQVLGKYLRTDVIKGTPFVSTQTVEFGGAEAEVRVAPNMVAVSVPADNIKAASPEIGPNSRVNVYVAYELDSGGKKTQVSKEEFKNIRVLNVLHEDGEGKTIQGVTLEVSQQDAPKLNFAARFGEIRLGLLKQGEYKAETVNPYTVDQVMGGASISSQPASASGQKQQ